MAELTNLETKLGEVLGLAMAAQGATEKVKTLDELDGDLARGTRADARGGEADRGAGHRGRRKLRGQEDGDSGRGARGQDRRRRR